MSAYEIDKPPNRVRKLPLSFRERSSALQAIHENWHGVGEIKSYNRRGNDCVERAVRHQPRFLFDG